MKESGLPAFAAEMSYYDHVARGYDLIAASYDDVEVANAVGRRVRKRMQDALFRSFRPGDRVLELGCGTGIEALALAARGVDVVATDLSEAMVERVREKVKARNLSNVAVRRLAAHNVGRLAHEFGEASFQGAYAHGGVLNMDPRLGDVADGLARLLRPTGRFLCTVVNQASLFEVLFYPLVLKPRKAFRRLGNVIPIPITSLDPFKRYVVPTRFYSPRTFVRIFENAFALHRLEGLQILLPPWNLAEYVDRLEPLARAVETVERRLADKAPFNAWGSLFLAEFVRVEA
jgi:ubiquinone/menaquinone biosynthesis C-methylase UbiE